MPKKKFRLFKKARAFVRKLELRSKTEWEIYRKSGKKPDDIPTNPQTIYKNEWKGWADFLGTTNVSGRIMHMQFRSLTETKKFARSLNLKNRAEWEKLARAGKLPKDIPRLPDNTYKNKNWSSWGDFLGTGNIATHNREYITHDESRKFVRKLKLTGQKGWVEYCKSGKKPDDIPYNPDRTYKKEFKGYGDWLGTGNIQNSQREFWSFKKARAFVRKLELQTQLDWKNYCKSGKLPKEIPTNPNRTYKKEWKSFVDWFGIDKITNKEKSKNWLSIKEAKKEARKIAKKLGIKTTKDWREAYDAGKIPSNLPKYLSDIYSGKSKKKRRRNEK